MFNTWLVNTGPLIHYYECCGDLYINYTLIPTKFIFEDRYQEQIKFDKGITDAFSKAADKKDRDMNRMFDFFVDKK